MLRGGGAGGDLRLCPFLYGGTKTEGEVHSSAASLLYVLLLERLEEGKRSVGTVTRLGDE